MLKRSEEYPQGLSDVRGRLVPWAEMVIAPRQRAGIRPVLRGGVLSRYPGRRHRRRRRRRGGVALGFHGVASWWVPGIPVLAVVFGMLTKQLYKFTMLHGCNTILSSILGSWVSAVLEGFVGLCRSPGIRW